MDCHADTCHVKGARWCSCWSVEDDGCGCRYEFETVEAGAGRTGVQVEGSIDKNRVRLDSKISFNANNASLLDVAIMLDDGCPDWRILVPVRRTGEKINLDIKQKTLKELIDSLGLVLANSP